MFKIPESDHMDPVSKSNFLLDIDMFFFWSKTR